MKIALIVAMPQELELLKVQLSEAVEQKYGPFTFHLGNIGNHQIIAMQCGIGKVNAAIGTTTLISRYSPDCVINTGVAGAASNTVSVMDIVVGERVAHHDVWCGPENAFGAVQGLPLYYTAAERLLAALPENDHVHRGLICSGDQFIDTQEELRKITKTFPEALAVDMESASIAQTCLVLGVDFLSLRVISDSPEADHDNTTQYFDFWTDAPKHTFEYLRQLIHRL